MWKHGLSGYSNYGCRCWLCTLCATQHMREYREDPLVRARLTRQQRRRRGLARPNKNRAYRFVDPAYRLKPYSPKVGGAWLLFEKILHDNGEKTPSRG